MKLLVITLIRFYQRYLRGLFALSCRYSPSCSDFTLQAIEKHGLFKGMIKGANRVIRCNGFFRGGWDPAK